MSSPAPATSTDTPNAIRPLIIGSFAVRLHQEARQYTPPDARPPRDIDVLVTAAQFARIRAAAPSARVPDDSGDAPEWCIADLPGCAVPVDAMRAAARPDFALAMHVAADAADTRTYTLPVLGECTVAPLELLCTLYASHVHRILPHTADQAANVRAWDEHMRHWLWMRQAIGYQHADALTSGLGALAALFRAGITEVARRVGDTRVSMDKSADAFFDDNVPRIIAHDELHRHVARAERDSDELLFERFRAPDSDVVAMDEARFLAAPRGDQVQCLVEELCVLYLERKLLPDIRMNGILAPAAHRASFATDMLTVAAHFCTNLCGSGNHWLRRFALAHYGMLRACVTSEAVRTRLAQLAAQLMPDEAARTPHTAALEATVPIVPRKLTSLSRLFATLGEPPSRSPLRGKWSGSVEGGASVLVRARKIDHWSHYGPTRGRVACVMMLCIDGLGEGAELAAAKRMAESGQQGHVLAYAGDEGVCVVHDLSTGLLLCNDTRDEAEERVAWYKVDVSASDTHISFATYTLNMDTHVVTSSSDVSAIAFEAVVKHAVYSSTYLCEQACDGPPVIGGFFLSTIGRIPNALRPYATKVARLQLGVKEDKGDSWPCEVVNVDSHRDALSIVEARLLRHLHSQFGRNTRQSILRDLIWALEKVGQDGLQRVFDGEFIEAVKVVSSTGDGIGEDDARWLLETLIDAGVKMHIERFPPVLVSPRMLSGAMWHWCDGRDTWNRSESYWKDQRIEDFWKRLRPGPNRQKQAHLMSLARTLMELGHRPGWSPLDKPTATTMRLENAQSAMRYACVHAARREAALLHVLETLGNRGSK